MRFAALGALTPLLALAMSTAATPARKQLPLQFPPMQGQSIDQYLRGMGLDDGQLADAAKGEPAVKLLPSENDRDVVVFGVVAVQVSRSAYLAHALDTGRLIAPGAHRFHLIGEPATAADLQDAAYEDSEYRNLRNCRPGDCKFKLPLSAMKEYAQEVVWSGPGAKAQADALLQRDLLRLINDYRAHGDSALLTYDDTHGTRAADAFAAILAQWKNLYRDAPELRQYLASYPHTRPASTRDIMYWSDDHYPGLRPTITLNHLVVHTPPAGAALIARKQLYADHYLEAGLDLLTIAPDTNEARSYLIVVRRLRFDNLPGGLFNIRRRVRNKMVDLMRSELTRERLAAEQREQRQR
jgi:hypothetical protein